MTAEIRKVLTLEQHNIAKALGGTLAPPTKPTGVIDDNWIDKANAWWKEHCNFLGIRPLAQPPYILGDTLGLINLKEMQ
jgi:hypothetical protein